MFLHALKPARGSKKLKKRVARGNSSNGGTTAGRGTKGQQSRTGKGRKFGFEGGQNPLIRKQPKLGGFTPPHQKKYEVVNVGDLEQALPDGAYDVAALRAKRLIRTNLPVKLLSRGELKKKFELSVHAVSDTARAAVEKAGGKVTIVK